MIPPDKNVAIKRPVSAPSAQVREELSHMGRVSTIHRAGLFALGAAGPAYCLYKIGELPDHIKWERTGAAAAVLVGGVSAMGVSIGMELSGTRTIKSAVILSASIVSFGTGAGYLAARAVFRKSPHTSLLAGLILGGLLAIYEMDMDAINNGVRQFLGLSTGQPTQDVPISKPMPEEPQPIPA